MNSYIEQRQSSSSCQTDWFLIVYNNMQYILVIEFESTGDTTCNIKGLPGTVTSNLESYLRAHNVICNSERDCFEVDIEGINLLNVLSGPGYNYKVATQSMAIDSTTIGGRSVKIQKTIWTLSKDE